jgi:hypothetical protein
MRSAIRYYPQGSELVNRRFCGAGSRSLGRGLLSPGYALSLTAALLAIVSAFLLVL